MGKRNRCTNDTGQGRLPGVGKEANRDLDGCGPQEEGLRQEKETEMLECQKGWIWGGGACSRPRFCKKITLAPLFCLLYQPEGLSLPPHCPLRSCPCLSENSPLFKEPQHNADWGKLSLLHVRNGFKNMLTTCPSERQGNRVVQRGACIPQPGLCSMGLSGQRIFSRKGKKNTILQLEVTRNI